MPDHEASRIGVGQPGRERRRAGIDQEPGQDQPARDGVGPRLRRRSSRSRRLAGDAGHQQHAAEEVDRGIAQAGGRAPAPRIQTTSVEPIAITSQKTKRVTRSPAKATPMALPA